MPAPDCEGKQHHMQQLAEDVQLLAGFPRYAINVYLLGDVLIDAGTCWSARSILRQIRGRKLTSHALTHAHPDHQGSSHAVCTAMGLPLWCGDADATAMENRGEIEARMPSHWFNRTISPFFAGPPHPVSRRLKEGDAVGTFTVIETPGHTDGHISFWREADGILVVGDVLANLSLRTGRLGLREPPPFFSRDPAQNRRSARRLAALEPKLVCFGHGPPMRETGRFVDFIERLTAGRE
ncbi:MAG: MBL fold metallo-hydrolase [Isosphaeraceae bacterium]